MNAPTVRSRVRSLFKSIFRSRPTERIIDWARRTIRLTTEESGDFPGSYDPDLNPLPTLLFEIYESGEYDECWIKKSSQSGVTLAVLILLTWFSCFVRRNWMYVLDSATEMKRVSKARLQPMIKGAQGLKDAIPEGKDEFTNLTLFFKGFVGYMAGAQSSGALANKSIGLGICDELDTYMEENEKAESHAAYQLLDRLKKQAMGFFIGLSKPRNFGDITNQEYLKGTRHKCFLPCPHCGVYQELIWSQVVYSHCKDEHGVLDLDRVVNETFYQCAAPECYQPIYDHHKPWMLERREWRRTNFGQDKWKPVPRKFSCEITDLTSTFPKTTLGILAKEWIEAQGSIDKLKAFKRGRLAQPWEEKRVEVKESDVMACVGDYEQGHCPVPPDLVTACADRQHDVFKAVKCAWKIGRFVDQCWVVDEFTCGTFSEFLAWANKPVIVDDWAPLGWPATPDEQRINPVALTGLVDEGYKAYQTRKLCLSTKVGEDDDGVPVLRFFPSKGRGGMQVRDMIWTVDDRTEDDEAIKVYHYSDDDFKSMVYEEAIANRAKILASLRTGEVALAPLLHIFKDPRPEFIGELCQEQRKPAIIRNKPTMVWAEPKDANDFGDALKENFITYTNLRPQLIAAAA